MKRDCFPRKPLAEIAPNTSAKRAKPWPPRRSRTRKKSEIHRWPSPRTFPFPAQAYRPPLRTTRTDKPVRLHFKVVMIFKIILPNFHEFPRIRTTEEEKSR
ncbi:hypothetical protein L596_013015 [Steinernema carpocapsae]|uniref:Uncharacterized protein n=1 Tax=Steinernema carpocapsae TaxID=34508 RepID=A0A4U5NZQ9_STECR|nr:hypothetical protein L596_013015 [Steinernema carpocapsae]